MGCDLHLMQNHNLSPGQSPCYHSANIKELLKTGALIKILQEEKTHTRTFDERPVLITGPTRTVLEVQKAVCERYVARRLYMAILVGKGNKVVLLNP